MQRTTKMPRSLQKVDDIYNYLHSLDEGVTERRPLWQRDTSARISGLEWNPMSPVGKRHRQLHEAEALL